MRKLKLTDKIKYTMSADNLKATLYARRFSTGQWEAAFTCNPATVPFIRTFGFWEAARRGLLRAVPD